MGKIGGPFVEKGQLFFLHPYLIDTITLSETQAYLDKCFLHQKFIVENKNYDEIAKEIGCSRSTVKTYLQKFGINKTTQHHHVKYGARRIKKRDLDHKGEQQTIATITKLYEEGLHPRGIARVLDSMKVPTKKRAEGWHHHTIITILKREGLYVSKSKSRRKK